MVELFEQHRLETDTKSSKGNQLKWRDGDIWYKADFTGYEGLAEYLISHLLQKSSLDSSEFVLYDLETIKYKNNVYNGVKSKNFLKKGHQLITLERLFKNVYGQSLNSMIYKTPDDEDRLKLIVNETERITGLKNFGKYMSKILTVDSFFLNEDRHTHNIAVLMHDTNQYEICPIFDQGAALLADTTIDYPLTDDDAKLYDMMDSVKPKTFCNDFLEQLEIVEKLYGQNIEFYFSKQDVRDILDAIPVGMYSDIVINRVLRICLERIRQLGYLCKPRK
ncbi:MAG: hypothetical protein K6F84_07375 [Lachnospiraceae bacterium]|nr:hypothetical protein [Lachnospiraceae bacterium]